MVTVALEQAESNPDTPEVIEREVRAEVGSVMLVAMPIGLVFAVTAAVLSTQRVLRPLTNVIEAAARMTARDLGQRLPLPGSNTEVRDVVLALNGLLGRLEAGFAALDRFAADASHELRTPLTVLATEIEIMLERPRAAAQWERTAVTCLDEVRQLAQLVESLLRMARAERAVDPQDTRGELGALLRRALAQLQPRAQRRCVQLHIELGSEIERVLAGEDVLLSAFNNVIDNAIRFTPSGGSVRVWSLAMGDGRVAVHVDDDGPGVDASEREKIFEPFARGAAGRVTQAGFGLGLAIARRICEHHGVELGVCQSDRGGARFRFVFGLPVAEARANHAPLQAV
jgi:two-component system heavy metal sensor histidine kinase CusS